MQGFITNADYSGKKTDLVLFINGRPVDCSPLKKAIENTYSSMLPKAAKPWLYLVNPIAELIERCGHELTAFYRSPHSSDLGSFLILPCIRL